MAIALHSMQSRPGAKQTKRRNGRGLGRKGTTAGRGQKGQSSRSGVGGLRRLGMRKLILSTPKLRGFRSLAPKANVVNVGDFNEKYIAGEVVTAKTLLKKGLITDASKEVKVLAAGDLTVAVTVKGCSVSKAAADKIAKAGGKVA